MLFLKILLFSTKKSTLDSVQYPHYPDIWVIEVFSLDEAYKTWMSEYQLDVMPICIQARLFYKWVL